MITVEFKDFNEMVGFAKDLLGVQAGSTITVKADAIKAAVAKELDAQVPQPPIPDTRATIPAAPTVPAAPVQRTTPVALATPAAPAASVQPAAPAVPTSAKAYTLDDLARAATTLMDAGRQEDLIGLLQQFSVAALPALPQEQYGAFATALRGMGAQI